MFHHQGNHTQEPQGWEGRGLYEYVQTRRSASRGRDNSILRILQLRPTAHNLWDEKQGLY